MTHARTRCVGLEPSPVGCRSGVSAERGSPVFRTVLARTTNPGWCAAAADGRSNRKRKRAGGRGSRAVLSEAVFVDIANALARAWISVSWALRRLAAAANGGRVNYACVQRGTKSERLVPHRAG
jgi:hypothetical protein